MTRTWRVREATPSDYPEMNLLFKKVFGGVRTLEHDHWRFSENPFGPPMMVVAEDGSRLVGQYGVWPTPVRLGTKSYVGAQCIDAVTLPEYQGQGMFTALASTCHELAARQDIVMVYAVPNDNSYFAFRHRLNFHHVFDFPRWTRLLDPAAHPRIPRLIAPVASVAARLLPLPSDATVRIEMGWPSPGAIEGLLADWRAVPSLCRIERSTEWWNYRCGAGSGRQYQCLTGWRGTTLVALAVWAPDPFSHYPRGMLAELVCADGGAGRAVISAAIQAARSAGCAVLNTVANDPAILAVLRACGFFRLRATPFILRQLTPRTLGANVHDPDAWRILGADLDTL